MVVLATKCYVSGDARNRALDGMRSLVDNDVGDLDVVYEVDIRDDDFIVVTVDGADAVVARNVLAEEWGEIPDSADAFEPGEEYVGTLEQWDDEGFLLDAGTEIRVPADELGLGRGSPEQVVERFGLVQHLPMRFVYGGEVEVDSDDAADDDAEDDAADDAADDSDDETDESDDAETEHVPTHISKAEQDRLYDWQRGSGRVNVNSATRGEVRATVNRAGHANDIVTVERLGLLEQSIVCAEGTDPPGLLAAIGSYLPAEMRCVV